VHGAVFSHPAAEPDAVLLGADEVGDRDDVIGPSGQFD
jgi:hypothetical protein